MQPAGLAAFAARVENKSGIYAYEQRSEKLPEPYAGLLRKNKAAWKFFRRSFRLSQGHRLVDHEREAGETRRRRLQKLIAASAKGERLR